MGYILEKTSKNVMLQETMMMKMGFVGFSSAGALE
jgi:hypothetical protein